MYAAVIMVNRVCPHVSPTSQKQIPGLPCRTWPARDQPQLRLVLPGDSMLLVVVMWFNFSIRLR